jgi:uncharacterized protein (TIGR03083 family)
VDHLEHCAALEVEITRFSNALGRSEALLPVPTCPGWSVQDLVTHVGQVHRWAEHLVRVRAPVRIAASEMDFDRGPPTPAWVVEGGTGLVATLRDADPDGEMWAWGADQHVRFWSRRQLHETLVHRIDLELAESTEPAAEAGVAADAIDEFLVNLSPAATFSPGVRELRGHGRRLAFTELDGGRRWVVALEPDGFSVAGHDLTADAELEAGALELLLVLYRRRPPGEATVVRRGDLDLLHFWFDHSALE